MGQRFWAVADEPYQAGRQFIRSPVVTKGLVLWGDQCPGEGWSIRRVCNVTRASCSSTKGDPKASQGNPTAGQTGA